MIRFGGIRTATGYFSAAVPRAGPGVLLLHDDLGITPALAAFADRLTAEERLTVLAPDLTIAGDERVARASGLGKRTAAILRDAAAHITLNWHPRLGLVGFSTGAEAAMHFGTLIPVEAAVVYYGYVEVDERTWATPLLGHFGALDDRVSPDAAAGLFGRLHDAEFSLYDGAGHYFANPQVAGAFRGADAEAAWQSTVDFLRYYLS